MPEAFGVSIKEPSHGYQLRARPTGGGAQRWPGVCGGGLALIAAADPDGTTPIPLLWQLLAVVPGTVLVVAGLTAIPAGLGARRPVAEILQSELA
jgi:hypothetical protein